jgi:hypothetical protein
MLQYLFKKKEKVQDKVTVGGDLAGGRGLEREGGSGTTTRRLKVNKNNFREIRSIKRYFTAQVHTFLATLTTHTMFFVYLIKHIDGQRTDCLSSMT